MTRAAFAVLGVALLARAAFVLLDTIPLSQYPEILVWLAAGVLVHDVVIAPATLALGRILRPGAILAAGWLASGVVVLLSYPLVKGAARRQNATVIPHSPGVGLTVSLAIVLLGLLLAWAVRRHQRRRLLRQSTR